MSKPQLVVTDMSGHHATNMPETVARLQRGATWKKQRVVVIIPSADMISVKVMMALWNLAFPPNNGVVKIAALGDEVGVAYSNAIESVLAHPDLCNWEYILTVESDNIPPVDGVVRLMECMESHPEMSCIGGLYFCKGPEGCAHLWGDVRDPVLNYRPQIPVEGFLETYGTSMGFNLWRTSLFKDERIKRPWFRTLNGKDGQGIGTQDLSFWSEARKYGYRCGVDCSVKVGHIDVEGKFGPPDFVW